jgi:hypothetical protein
MKEYKMKMITKTMLTVLALGALAFAVGAQDNNNPPGNRGPSGQHGPGLNGQHGPGMNGQRPPPPAIIGAIDANHDGVIDADEIANASAALKALDKNGDGKLTPDEFMGLRPQHPGGPGKGPGGNRGADDNNVPPGPPTGDN